jgi:acetoin utilization deacetylase AcuC-like enzyme
MIDAALSAFSTGCACAPVSGFHHAHYGAGGGFCTFNGLVVAARKVIECVGARRVLILDCDMHFGDGTEQIRQQLQLTDVIENCSLGRWFDAPGQASRYLARLRQVAGSFRDYDLILYQAGADLHVDDPLGGVLTTPQMVERDRLVFESARQAGVPIAWNLAGGYQEPLSRVLELHSHTMRECVAVYCTPRAWLASHRRSTP